ncbi:MAG: homoserine dehydrogenase [Vampirovibrionales bacterium]|nr:homoserine dehydrogenase [Vampirovibrionales bacterium]
MQPPLNATRTLTPDTCPAEAPLAGLNAANPIRIGLLGLGVVGTGVYKLLMQDGVQGALPVTIGPVAVRNQQKTRDIEQESSLTLADAEAIVRDPEVAIVVEVMGGLEPAFTLVKTALSQGKHVVTANKALIATHGPELFELARSKNVRLLFEGAVAGGIPVIMPLKLSLAANRIEAIAGILNGTTNYILTQMAENGLDYQIALQQAQAKGFAEADPTSDVEAEDAAFKLSILATMAFRQQVMPPQIHRHGITAITADDISNARSLGCVIKLIALASKNAQDALELRVQPMLVPASHPLASISNEYNAIWIRGHAVGDVMFSGKGAGEQPTASAVTADILAIARDLASGNEPIPGMAMAAMPAASIQPPDLSENRYYIRVTTLDEPSVIGHMGLACGEAGVSLQSVMQQGTQPAQNNLPATASIMLLTHQVSHQAVRNVIAKLETLPSIVSIGSVLPVLPF